MKESVVEDHLKKEVKALGGLAIKFVPVVVLGFPDRIVLLPGGRIAFVELKRPGKEPRKAQWVWIEKLSRLGFEAVYLDTKEKVSAWLTDFAAK